MKLEVGKWYRSKSIGDTKWDTSLICVSSLRESIGMVEFYGFGLNGWVDKD